MLTSAYILLEVNHRATGSVRWRHNPFTAQHLEDSMERLRKKTWQEPKLIVHGDVAQITQTIDKKLGISDGYTFMGNAITNAS